MPTSPMPHVAPTLSQRDGRTRSGAVFALLAVLWLALTGQADATVAGTTPRAKPFNLTEARSVLDVIARNASLTALSKVCPADLFARDLPWWRQMIGTSDIPRETCAASPQRCLDRCLRWANPEACFSLGQAIEAHDDVLEEYRKEALFARACALGMDAGCTNRAAGIRNGDYEKDPFRTVPEPERAACLHRTFRIDCDHDGAWGCAMLGQSYQLGNGTEADLAKAREAFEKSCAIDADLDACAFAREALQAMGRPVKGEREVRKEGEKGQ